MAERSVLVRLQANIADFKSQMDQASRSVKGVGDQTEKTSREATTSLGRMAKSAKDNRGAWDDAGTALTVFGAVAVAALGATIKAAIDWESAWAGVTKTLPDDADFAATEKGLRNLAKTLPATHTEIAAVAEAAGQLGVAADAIVPFTKTMIDLGETTNLSADEAATAIAQMMNVMKTAPQDVGRLGAALVELGNNGASTEKDILNLTSYLTGAAALIGASESDVLALANTMTSLGINAERGGGVMTRTMQDIYVAVQNGGDALDGFAKVAGMSGADFARAFEADPIRAIGAFTDGLAAAKDRGDNVVGILSELGIKGTQDTAVLLQMAGAQGMLNENLDMGAKAWADNTALIDEANKRYDTTEAKIAIAKNNIVDAAIGIGEAFLPVVADIAEHIANVAQWFGALPDPIKAVAGQLGAIAGVGALAAGAFLLIFPRAIETYKAFQTLNATMPGTASGLAAVGKAAGIAGAIYAVAQAADALGESFAPSVATMEETTAALLETGTSLEEVNALFREGNAGLGSAGINDLADAAARLTDPGLVNRFDDFTAEVLSLGGAEGRDQRERVIEQLDKVGQSLGLMVESGNAELAAQQFDALASEWERGGGSIEELRDLMPGYTEALQAVENEQEIAAQTAGNLATNTGAAGAAVGQAAEDMGAAYVSLEAYAAALGKDEDATEALRKETEELGQSLADFVNPLGVYTTMLDEKAAAEEAAAIKSAEAAGKGADAWRDFVKDSGFSFDEYMRRLEEQVSAQANWQTNMLILAGKVSQGTLDELARMGPEGAPLVAELVNRSDAELARFDDITYLRSKEATDAWGVQLRLATPVLAAVGRVAGEGVVAELAAKLQAGTITVAEIARQYGVNLAGGINPVLGALGRREIHLATGRGYQAADGAIFDFYADGGVRESHVAQIARPGDWRVWAEPETGGEAYIPLAPGKRARSLDIWRETGRRLGIQDIENYANGGFSSVSDVPRPRSTEPFRPPISSAGNAAMEKVFEEVTAWLKANTEVLLGGTPGTGGALSGGSGRVAQLFNTVKAAFPEARLNSGFRPGDSGFHGRGMAVDLGWMRAPGGTGNPYMAAMNRWIFDRFGAVSKELIYNGSGDDRPNIKNGSNFAYSAATQAQHRNHVHWAMAKGGILNPHVRDQGGPLLPGYTFNGTGMRETVIPTPYLADVRGSSSAAVIDYQRLGSEIAKNARSLTILTNDNPTAIVRAVRAEERQSALLASAW